MGTQGPVPEDRFYRLPVPDPVAETGPAVDGTVGVARLYADGLHNERALLYVRAERPLELHRHHYDYWVESPPRMLQQHLLEYLRAIEFAPRVIRHDAGADVDYVVSGRLLRFERLVGKAGSSAVAVSLELALEPRAASGPGQVRTYSVVRPVADESIYAAVQGFARALEEMYARFAAELAKH